MTLDEILSQVAGGFQFTSLSLDHVLRAVLVLIIGVVVIKLVQRAVERILSRNTALDPIHRYLRSAVSIVLWLLLALVLLGSLGVELTSIIALLSVAGLAVSLALQNSLSNLAGGIVLLVSKPFSTGDYVEIGSVTGTVSMIGLSYSTLITVENKEIYIPNSQLSSATIINYTRLGKRRMELTFSASYGDPIETVKAALQDAVDQFPTILTDPAPEIRLCSYGESGVNYLIRAWTTTADYWDTYYRLLEAVLPAFQRRGVSMPYPQMDVHIVSSPQRRGELPENRP